MPLLISPPTRAGTSGSDVAEEGPSHQREGLLLPSAISAPWRVGQASVFASFSPFIPTPSLPKGRGFITKEKGAVASPGADPQAQSAVLVQNENKLLVLKWPSGGVPSPVPPRWASACHSLSWHGRAPRLWFQRLCGLHPHTAGYLITEVLWLCRQTHLPALALGKTHSLTEPYQANRQIRTSPCCGRMSGPPGCWA